MRKFIYWTLLGTVLLLCSGTALLFYKMGQNITECIQMISGFSSFIVALLTAAYVFTTTNQLVAMEQQLQEMRRARELENQPFPWLEAPKFIITRPEIFYTPPQNEASIPTFRSIDIAIFKIMVHKYN